MVDMATLTGAQGVATGQYHAAIVTNDEDWEKASVCAGKRSGDLVVQHDCFSHLHRDYCMMRLYFPQYYTVVF